MWGYNLEGPSTFSYNNLSGEVIFLVSGMLAFIRGVLSLIRGGTDKNIKNILLSFCFFHLGSLGIYVDKMDPNLYKKKTRSAPLGVPTSIYPRFVSDWTGDSHVTHLPSKTMDFWF